MVYFITSALIGIFEQKMIRRDLRAAGILPATGTSGGESATAGSTDPVRGPAGLKGPGRPGNGKGKGKVSHR
jgi:hypothetical protein